MNISETMSYDKDGKVEHFPLFKKLFLSIVILLVATLSFGIGRLSTVGEREPIKIEYDEALETQAVVPKIEKNNVGTASVINSVSNNVASTINTQVVVSKNGERYHYMHCAGAKQIKEENKIFFATPEAAEVAGYSLALNCSPK